MTHLLRGNFGLLALFVILFIPAAFPQATAAASDIDDIRGLATAAADWEAPDESRTQSMAKLVALGPAAITGLSELLKDDNPLIRSVATLALGRIGHQYSNDSVMAPLIEAFRHDDNAVVVANAALALGETANPKAVSPLLGALDVNDDTVRMCIIRALAQTHHREVIQPLVTRFSKESTVEMRREIVRALGSLGARAELEQLRPSVTDDDLKLEIDRYLKDIKSGAPEGT